jgi:hypothetical protein
MRLTKDVPRLTDRLRNYDEEMIPRVRTLVAMSEGFGGHFSLDILIYVFDHYEEGVMVFDEGVTLSWSIND